jgi:putative glycosyltransferase (TIGR04348 family)
VAVLEQYAGQQCDLLVALHARKSYRSVVRYRRQRPEGRLVVALTGTDLYQDLKQPTGPGLWARRSLDLADRIVLLQPEGLKDLTPAWRAKARPILQSAAGPAKQPRHRREVFEVCVLGHLREVKDPLRAAHAARLLPPESRVRVIQVGRALSPRMARLARAEMEDNPRYTWLGELPRWRAMRVLARCRLLCLSSVLEGGANVISEAVAVDTPVISSWIAGSVGMLGEDYPGYFPVGDTQALAALLRRAETDPAFLKSLRDWGRRLRPALSPARERRAWAALLSELFPD